MPKIKSSNLDGMGSTITKLEDHDDEFDEDEFFDANEDFNFKVKESKQS